MSEQTGDKTEQPTQKRLEESFRKGQFPKSQEVQTIAVLAGGMGILYSTGHALWQQLALSMSGMFSHLHDIQLTQDSIPREFMRAALTIGGMLAPVVASIMMAGLLVGALQSRFRLVSEALEPNWERLNFVEGFKRVFSFKAVGPALIALIKLAAVIALSYGTVQSLMGDPIFSTPVSMVRIGEFIGESAWKIVMRVAGVLAVIAAIDYGYQFWKTQQDLMMTRSEVKDEMKDSEGNPTIKAQMRKRRRQISQRKMLEAVPKADVVVTNPTHIAIALRYDRATMRAPKIVAKGTRLNALRIREIAQQHQIPIIENKPLARTLLKLGKVGAEIPVQFYTAVAEILAWVYRVNRYRYYTERNRE